ncbi:hypothetical protein [Streptomyces sp. SP18CM02]|uniref:hypothetical protein n=1 Tax=Streptomyces sp. SP18CM02 TaxID=2758571 RepID=UPI00168C0CDD|nr:hypothetical protein [Streptomyces sp. SP18CM02]MBD3550909.1 hypothetical protein [Streptomyces sp. SP18CM02]
MRFLRRSAPPAPEPPVVRCRHITENVEPVHDVDGRLVAALCTACDASLPAWQACKNCGYMTVDSLGSPGEWRELMTPCQAHAADAR